MTTKFQVPKGELSEEKKAAVKEAMDKVMDETFRQVRTVSSWGPPPIPLVDLIGWLIDEEGMFEKKRQELRKGSPFSRYVSKGFEARPIMVNPDSIFSEDIA